VGATSARLCAQTKVCISGQPSELYTECAVWSLMWMFSCQEPDAPRSVFDMGCAFSMSMASCFRLDHAACCVGAAMCAGSSQYRGFMVHSMQCCFPAEERQGYPGPGFGCLVCCRAALLWFALRHRQVQETLCKEVCNVCVRNTPDNRYWHLYS
jgi:hypothetical protein